MLLCVTERRVRVHVCGGVGGEVSKDVKAVTLKTVEPVTVGEAT